MLVKAKCEAIDMKVIFSIIVFSCKCSLSHVLKFRVFLNSEMANLQKNDILHAHGFFIFAHLISIL